MRCFIALALEPSPAEALAGWLESARSAAPELAITPAQNLHLTLAFLGELSDDAVEAARDVVVETAARSAAPSVEWGSAGAFPSRPRARVFWIGVEIEARLAELHRSLAEALTSRSLPVEMRPYRPHLTLARLRPRTLDRARLAELVELMSTAPTPKPARGTAVVLYRSRLGAPSAVHEPLVSAALG